MLRTPHESQEPGTGPFFATPAAPQAPVAREPVEDKRLTALVREAFFEEQDAHAILDADKVLIGGNWFCLLHGELVGGPVNVDGTLEYSACLIIDMGDHFEYADLTRKAERMLAAGG